MPDQIESIQRTVKLRTVGINIRNDGPAITAKSVVFTHTVVPSSADGVRIGRPLAQVEEQVSLADIIADPRVQQALALIDEISQERLAAQRGRLMAMIQED